MKNSKRRIKTPDNLSASDSVIKAAVSKVVAEAKSPEELKRKLRAVVHKVVEESNQKPKTLRKK
jgi:hypothetical protein